MHGQRGYSIPSPIQLADSGKAHTGRTPGRSAHDPDDDRIATGGWLPYRILLRRVEVSGLFGEMTPLRHQTASGSLTVGRRVRPKVFVSPIPEESQAMMEKLLPFPDQERVDDEMAKSI